MRSTLWQLVFRRKAGATFRAHCRPQLLRSLIIAALIAPMATRVFADDPSFRDLPGAMSPADLSRVLSSLPFDTQTSGEGRPLTADELVDRFEALEKFLPPDFKRPSRDELRRWAESAVAAQQASQPQPKLPRPLNDPRNESARNNVSPPNDNATPRPTPSVQQPESFNPSNANSTNALNPFRPRRSVEPPGVPSSDSTSKNAVSIRDLSPADLDELRKRMAEIPVTKSTVDSSSTKPVESAENSDSKPNRADTPLRSRVQFNGAMNKILWDAAQRIADAHESADSSSSSSSLSKPLAEQFRKLLARPNPAWQQRVRQFQEEQRKLGRAIPASALAKSPASDSSVLFTASSTLGSRWYWIGIGAVICLAAALIAMRNRIARQVGWLGPARRSPFKTPSLYSRSDLVRALDRFLIWEFGREAHWWNCGVVERVLVERFPSRHAHIARLSDSYRLARFGPETAPISDQELADAATVLRELADGESDSPDVSSLASVVA